MRDDEFLWNVEETRAVRYSYIRNFTLDPGDNCINLIGWFNDSESFLVKSFKSYAEGQKYLKKEIFGEKEN
jgi:hypothetical protein